MIVPSYRKNIGVLYVVEFFSFFGITTFWVLFLSQNGMTLLEIGLLESIFHGTSLLSEIPSGMLADRFSYKSNLLVGRMAAIVSCILMICGQGHFWIYALAMMVNAWAYNFDSGTSSAMLYDSAVHAGLKDRYLAFSSVISGVAEATMSLGAVLAGFFVHGQLEVTYYIMIGYSLCAMILISLLKEPDSKSVTEEKITLSSIVQTVVKEFKTNPALLLWLLIGQIFCATICMFYFYYQNQLPTLSSWQIAALMLVGTGFNIGAAYLASQLGKKWSSFQLFPWIVGLTGLLYGTSILNQANIHMLIYLLTNALYALYMPIVSNDIQSYLPNSVRATMLSVNAMFFSLSMILLFPLTGWMIDKLGFTPTFLTIGSFLCISSFILAFFLGKVQRMLQKS
ncbi:MFS transporter [Streptococcus cuniculi]|uniref:MFS transporter n=1 Tax=Streptococcus cuniculi TaxID=1432788 RepID=A0A4Y9JEL3_9STRE|nr:MFS transporter [Streptococcus cuniculi]MBF0777415.1 MFS transporter [Streptococcus cuniculi]TFU99011.1 MFS transporter [Streptococcus cuniculi]